MKNQYQAILLDVDGTLLDFNQAEADGMKVVLKTYGFEPTQERLSLYHEINERAWAAFERGEVTKERLVCQRFVDFFGALGKEVDGEAAEKLYRSQLDASAILIEGALEICGYLQKKYDLYIVTNGTSSTQYKRLAASGLDRFVKDIFVSEDAGSQKPQIPSSRIFWEESRRGPIPAGIIPGDCRGERIFGRIMRFGRWRS